jgi:SAM-dependent methyltransferase
MATSRMTQLSFDTAASAWDRFSVRASTLYVPALLTAAGITAGQRVLDVATGTGLSAVEAAALVGPSGLVLGTDISLPMLERAKRHAERLPISLVVMDGQALACRDASFDAVICLLGLMFFADAARGLAEFRRVLRPAGRVAVCVTTTPDRTVYGRVFACARRYLPPGQASLAWNFALSEPHRLEALLCDAGFCDVAVRRELRQVPFDALDDYWAAMEAGGGCPERRTVRSPRTTAGRSATRCGVAWWGRDPTGHLPRKWRYWWAAVVASQPIAPPGWRPSGRLNVRVMR